MWVFLIVVCVAEVMVHIFVVDVIRVYDIMGGGQRFCACVGVFMCIAMITPFHFVVFVLYRSSAIVGDARSKSM